MKKNARQWGFFAILLTAVLASGQVGATTVLFAQAPTLANLGVDHFPLWLLDTGGELALPDGSTFHLSAPLLTDWLLDSTPRALVFDTVAAAPPLPTGLKSEGHNVATEFRSSRVGLSEREMAVWKSNGEPEDWLFRMQFTRAFDYEEPEPLIPIPEPTTGLLVIMGIAGRALWGRCAERRGRPTPSI